MKRSIFTLASALIIFIITLFATNDYVVNEEVHDADLINEMQVQNIRVHMDKALYGNERAVHSFLSGIFFYDIKSVGGKTDTVIHIREKEIPAFKRYVYSSLRNFIKMNNKIVSASFLIDPSVYPDKGPHGYAPEIVKGDTTNKNLVNEYEFVNSETYQYAKKTNKCTWRLPSEKSPLYGKVIMYVVPIQRESGAFFGIFRICINIDILRNGLSSNLPYGKENSFIIAVDNDDDIIFSTEKFHDKFKKVSDYTAFLEADEEFHREKTDSIHHDVASWHGKEYFIYHSKLTNAPWQTITVCRKDAIYEDVIMTQNIIFIVSVIGMLLMLVCCLMVFMQMRRHIQQKARIDEELKMASKVQQSLLKPTSITQRPSPTTHHPTTLNAFMRPARETGGDLYDYVEKDGKLIFCIGDVSGKGMPAALFMTQVVSLFRNAVRNTTNPKEIVSQINDVLSSNNPDMTFCTFFMGIIDGNTLSYCNAGHNPPVLLGKGAKAKYMKVKSNMALGLWENYPYESETIVLSEGDMLIMYTDGITEAKNKSDQCFGDDHLLTVADSIKTPESTIDTILNAVDYPFENIILKSYWKILIIK